MAFRLLCFLLAGVVLGISNCAASNCSQFDLIPENLYDRSPDAADDIDKRPLGYQFAIAYYDPTDNQENPCAFLTNLTGHAVEVMVETRIPGKSLCVKDDTNTVTCNEGGDFSNCWNAKSDKVTFTFYCDHAEGCDTDTQFWYRLTPSVGDHDDWCSERTGDFPRSLIPRPTNQVGKNTISPTSGSAIVLPLKGTFMLPALYMMSLWV